MLVGQRNRFQHSLGSESLLCFAGVARNRAQYVRIGKHGYNRMLSGIRIRFAQFVQCRREIIVSVRREKNRHAQSSAGGRFDKAVHQLCGEIAGCFRFRVRQQMQA